MKTRASWVALGLLVLIGGPAGAAADHTVQITVGRCNEKPFRIKVDGSDNPLKTLVAKEGDTVRWEWSSDSATCEGASVKIVWDPYKNYPYPSPEEWPAHFEKYELDVDVDHTSLVNEFSSLTTYWSYSVVVTSTSGMEDRLDPRIMFDDGTDVRPKDIPLGGRGAGKRDSLPLWLSIVALGLAALAVGRSGK